MLGKKTILTTSALVGCFLIGVLAGGTLSVSAAGPLTGFALDRGPGPLLERLANRLELTPEQRREIRGILVNHVPRLAELLAAVKDTRRELFNTIHTHPPVESEIRDRAAEVATVEAELAVLRSEIVDEVYQVLDADQQQEMAEMKADLLAWIETLTDHLGAAFRAQLGA